MTLIISVGNAQILPVGFSVVEETLRRNQLIQDSISTNAYSIRSIHSSNVIFPNSTDAFIQGTLISAKVKNRYPIVKLLPFQFHTEFNSHHPYLINNGPLVLNNGLQAYKSGGVYVKWGLLDIQLQPEIISNFFKSSFTDSIKSGEVDFIETHDLGPTYTFLLGQSSIRVNYGAFSIGASTQNIWWGPAQFNALTFTNNAPGFPHMTLNTRKPATTIIGSFEGQLIVGELRGTTGIENPEMPWLRDEGRYLNAITLIYQPKWIKGLFIGGTRTYQQYYSDRGKKFSDYLPIFDPFQKVATGDFINDIDAKGRDQQASLFARYIVPTAKLEMYFEYGRRDHAVNWREFLVSPEHARAYLVGFIKLISIPGEAHLQVRGEMLHQQEAISILVRYPGIGGSGNWGSHGTVRHGFTHRGQMLGPAIGPGSNVQTLETAWVKDLKKIGIRLERLNRHQDMYVKLYPAGSQEQPWVDYSLGLLADWQLNRLLFSSQLIFINSLNYQWGLDTRSTPEFPVGRDVFNVHGLVKMAYFFNAPSN